MSRRAPFIAGVVALVLVLLSVMLLVLPKMRQVGTTNDQLQEAQDEEVSLQAQVKTLQDAEAAAPQTEKQIKALEEQVPPTADLPGLFRLLQSAADVSGVDFFTFSPGVPAPDASGSFAVMSSSITVTGSYFAIDEYLYNLEHLPRAAKVMSVSLSPGAEAAPTGATTTTTTSSPSRLQTQLVVEFYTTDINAGPGTAPASTPEPGASPSSEPGA